MRPSYRKFPRPLTHEERIRIYCCLTECPMCGAHRGEHCLNRNKTPWTKGYHYMRSPLSRGRDMRDRSQREALHAAYMKLAHQAIAQTDTVAEVVGHE